MSKKTVVWGLIFIVVVVVFLSGIFSSGGSTTEGYQFFDVVERDVELEVSVSGRIEPVEERMLGFSMSGTVETVSASVGDELESGDEIAALERAELYASRKKAVASLEIEKLVLAELKRGARVEEITSSETAVANAERSLSEANRALASATLKADADLQQKYDTIVSQMRGAMLDAKQSLVEVTSIQQEHFTGDTQPAFILSELKSEAIEKIFAVSDTGDWIAEYVNNLSGGLYGSVVDIVNTSSDHDSIDVLLSRTQEALYAVRDVLNAVPITDVLSSTQKTILSTEKTSVSNHISSLSATAQSIAVQKVTNGSTIQAAEAAVTTAQNSLYAAQDQLAIKLSGSSGEQIASQEARVKRAQADVDLIDVQISKTSLKTPIDGVLTKQDARVGMVVAANQPQATVQSSGNFEIKARITEADIAKVSLGNKAELTLDAYSDDVILRAFVAVIDPAEEIIEGVPTYTVTLHLEDGDEYVRSGMTVNIDILTDSRQGVKVVPARSVTKTNEGSIVRILTKEGTVQRVQVRTGLRGSDGMIEIVEGVSVGQKVITYIPE